MDRDEVYECSIVNENIIWKEPINQFNCHIFNIFTGLEYLISLHSFSFIRGSTLSRAKYNNMLYNKHNAHNPKN